MASKRDRSKAQGGFRGLLPSRISMFSDISEPQEWLEANKEALVESSNVVAIRYDKRSASLYVRFRDNRTYAYYGVDIGLAEEMFFWTSMGDFVHSRLIQGGYKGHLQ